jgi:hypothetical protein
MRYTILTGLLTLVYVALVALASQVLAFRTPLAVAAVAAVALAAALLFNLPRHRVQRALRRRYHRPA